LPALRRRACRGGGLHDATTLSPPFNVYAEQMGLRVLAYVGDFLEFPQSGFTVSDATLKNKRDVIKRLLRGTLRGLQFTLKNRAETVRFIAKDYKLQEAIADKVYSSLLPAMTRTPPTRARNMIKLWHGGRQELTFRPSG
jgi:ABC-type nitrate/sulfonate/bicarbonate transport system substrate-binding protein